VLQGQDLPAAGRGGERRAGFFVRDPRAPLARFALSTAAVMVRSRAKLSLLALLGCTTDDITGTGGPLLPCNDVNDVLNAFEFAHGICCEQFGETCAPSTVGLPTTCASPTCARAVGLVNSSCATLLVSPSFPVGAGFKPLLDNATTACASAPDEPVSGRAAALTHPFPPIPTAHCASKAGCHTVESCCHAQT
jgi:hypothetical protein